MNKVVNEACILTSVRLATPPTATKAPAMPRTVRALRVRVLTTAILQVASGSGCVQGAG